MPWLNFDERLFSSISWLLANWTYLTIRQGFPNKYLSGLNMTISFSEFFMLAAVFSIMTYY